MKKILFILSGNLSTTPRALKNIELFAGDYDIETILVSRSYQWEEKDQGLITNKKLKAETLRLGRNLFFPWLKVTLIERAAQMIYPLLTRSTLINGSASNKSSIVLWENLKKKQRTSDMIFAHGAGSLYPAYNLSQKWKMPFIFDIEDYHPGEFIKKDARNEKARREFLMKKMLPKAHALTSASPMIGDYTMKLIGGHANHQVILNSFPLKEFREPTNQPINHSPSQLRLVWFSQKISFGRGLEQVLDAISLLNTQKEEAINLTLIGEMDDGFYQQVILPKLEEAKPCFVFMHIPPLSQPELHAELANHDVGLAMEFNSTDLNRQLCLTNKILAYAQAGLYILATDTPAQKDFLTQNPWSGFVCGQTEKAIMKALMLLIDQRIDIQEKALERFHKAKALAWENEGEKFRAMLTSVACQ